MAYRNCRGKIDWTRIIVYCAIFFVIFHTLIYFLGFKGMFIMCLAVIAWYFGPRIWRNIKLSRRTKAANKRPTVKRSQLLDID